VSSFNGQRIARRRVTRNADSLTVVIPRPFQYAMRLRLREVLELRLFPEQQGFRVRAVRDVPREEIEHWPDLREDVCQRKLVKYGNGVSVCVPRYFWHTLYCFPHDLLELILADDHLSIWVQPARARHARPVPTPDLLDVPEGAK
jgi:hypothetical protein